MKWYLLDTGLNSGKFNMDFDIELAGKCSAEQAFLRLYRWNPYCISLGANQNPEDINLEKAKQNRIDLVKRPTGGRAILHAEELTYSVVIPTSGLFSSTEIYRRVSLALVNGLKKYDPRLEQVELETAQPDFANILKAPSGMVCFGSTAKSEVKYKGLKLIGSAQRKMGHAILQHGSILCGDYHLNLIDYLNLSEAEIALIKDEILHKTIDLKSILDEDIDYLRLSELLIKGFEAEFSLKFENLDEISYLQ